MAKRKPKEKLEYPDDCECDAKDRRTCQQQCKPVKKGQSYKGLNALPYLFVVLIAGWVYVFSQMIPLW